MPIAHEFDYYRPKDLSEAVGLLSKHHGRARVLAGGTDLLVWLKEGLQAPEALVDLKGIPGLRTLEIKSGLLHIGALATFTDLLDSAVVRKKFPLLWEAAKVTASTGIRNRATLAGNICSAVPSMDGAPPLLVYEANVVVFGPSGSRGIPISACFIAPKKTVLKEGEIVTRISLPVPAAKNGACYVRLGRYEGEDLAQVCVGILALSGDTYRIAFGAVGPVPKRASKIEELLNGKRLNEELISKAQELIPNEISPITDIRASQEYRLHMSKVMLERGLRAAVARLSGKGPKYGERLI
jgi:CO/xanthine dehydrogenase FAD-binding subunit